jgi:hypothetical protein
MEQTLQTIKDNPEKDFYELQFLGENVNDKRTLALWRESFYKVFGADATLSLQTMYERHKRDNSLIYVDSLPQIAAAVANESHIKNLVILPESVTGMLKRNVFSSVDDRDQVNMAEVELAEEEKEQLVQFLNASNRLLITALESLEGSPGRNEYLGQIIDKEGYEERKQKLLHIKPENIRVKPSAWP